VLVTAGVQVILKKISALWRIAVLGISQKLKREQEQMSDSNSYTQVTHESWGSRIMGAIKGIIFGIVLFVLAFPVLFTNEGRAVKMLCALNEGAATVVSLPSVASVDPGFDGKLVHVEGEVETTSQLTDPVFAISDTAIRLERHVEMYQWHETSQSSTRKKTGGGTETTTTYTYGTDWSANLINANNFKQKNPERSNPSTMPWAKDSWQAADVRLGAYQLPAFLVDKISGSTSVYLSEAMAAELQLGSRPAQVYDNAFYFAANPAQPQVGDVRVRFSVTPAAPVSIVAVQHGNSFQHFLSSNGRRIALLAMGSSSAPEMFATAQAQNKMLTWLLRIAGFIMMLIGLNLVLRPLSVLADVLPFLGNLVETGTFLLSAGIAAALALITIAIAWIAYRPLIGVPLLLLAAGIVVMLVGKWRRSATASPATA